MNFDNDISKLHPSFRVAIQKILLQLKTEGIPLRIKEAYRTPQMQKDLVDTSDAPAPWHSKFQYGLACSFEFEDDVSGSEDAAFMRLGEIGKLAGLNYSDAVLSVVGYDAMNLFMGSYPNNGDASWGNNLSKHILEWSEGPKPPLPQYSDEQAVSGNAGTNSEREQKSVD